MDICEAEGEGVGAHYTTLSTFVCAFLRSNTNESKQASFYRVLYSCVQIYKSLILDLYIHEFKEIY